MSNTCWLENLVFGSTRLDAESFFESLDRFRAVVAESECTTAPCIPPSPVTALFPFPRHGAFS